MNKPLISIIVPIYNNEQYLGKCIESIVNQSYKNLEILLIDDGSKDNSWRIIQEYMKRDKRIVGYNKKNEGVSATRNFGIKKSKGEFIQFVDSDDTINKDMVSKLFEGYIDKKVDLVSCGFKKVNFKEIETFTLEESVTYSKKELIERYYALASKYYTLYSPCTSLYKKNILLYNNIFFNEEISLGEDVLFNLEYIQKIENIKILSEALYNYHVTNNSNSLTKKYDETLFYTQSIFFRKNIEFCENNDINNHINLQIIHDNYTKGIFNILLSFMNEKKDHRLREFVLILSKIDSRVFKGKNLSLKEKIFLFLLKNNLNIILYIYVYVIIFLYKMKIRIKVI